MLMNIEITWPMAVFVSVVVISIVSLLLNRWPWQKD
jgi:membrane-anchored protein YejM (alkaline phosphatase superfamily)